MEDRASRLTRVGVIGAGWAGSAAAVTLTRLGHEVSVFEAASFTGGRARRVMRKGLPLDNGQHLLIGAYLQTRNLLADVHGGNGESMLDRMPLSITPLTDRVGTFALQARRWPGRLGLIAGLALARGLTFGERMAMMRWFRRLEHDGFRCNRAMTVADLLASGPRIAADRLWKPLCLAALNTAPEQASAQIFANVLRAAFANKTGASDYLLAESDASSIFPDAAARFVTARRGHVILDARVRLEPDDDFATIVNADRHERFDAAVVAVAPFQFEDVVGSHRAFAQALSSARGLAYEPIATAWLGYARRTCVPAQITRLDDAPGQWLVDRPDIVARATPDATRPALEQVVGVVISAGGPHQELEAHALAIACDAQLRRLDPRWPPLAWSQTITEKRATYACVPGRPIPPTITPHGRVALAGDWLDAEYPATLEAAVRSGVAAAIAIDAALRDEQFH
ncbi:MAG TPA: hydroxysqualene dehydroxylase HpnE [Casimicrobiaceae bacterium]|nr:hydroxysqualene dehydroxylase HpnE [Casimicrobiaceae bacterium]